jgi:hypothetical protein
MTWITDDTGRRWVEMKPRERRRSPRALRFAGLKVGDQLQRAWASALNPGQVVVYYVVTDLWFDPVAGQYDDTAGRMVAIQRICPREGEPYMRKEAHTLRGLASQGFGYCPIDYMAHVKAANAAAALGQIVGIGHGHVIRRRPRTPGSRF